MRSRLANLCSLSIALLLVLHSPKSRCAQGQPAPADDAYPRRSASYPAADPPPLAHLAPDDQQLLHAIEQMKRFLYTQQNPVTGSWERNYLSPSHAAGETAIATLALLLSGESMQDPRLFRAISWLNAQTINGTYPASLRAHVLAQLPRDNPLPLQLDARWLLAAHDAGRFNYSNSARYRFDHSVTQYGVLGLWEASKAGVVVPPTFWHQVAQHFLENQNPDGGWGYVPGQSSTGSMTAAGLTTLLICQQQLHRKQIAPDHTFSSAIRRGLDWLDTHFQPDENPNGAHVYYYLYSIERVGLAAGITTLNHQNWFDAGARFILSQQHPDGSIERSVNQTAFALMFLSRGRVGVWASKLRLPIQNWNNRPNDLHFLTRYLNDLREADFAWQVVSIDDPPETWLNTPLLYLASDQSLELTPRQQAALKRYLDLGGTLLVNPDTGAGGAQAAITRLARNWYPHLHFRELEPDHPFYHSYRSLPPEQQQKITALSNGVRELILLPQRDWGYHFQADDVPGQSTLWLNMVNIWAHLTDRGQVGARLHNHYPVRTDPTAPATPVTIGRARYTATGRTSVIDNPEPLAWEPLTNQLHNQFGIDLTVRDVPLDDLGHCDLPLVHLAGVQSITLTNEQLLAILTYVEQGGTLLVETVGGHSGFARDIEAQLAPLMGGAALPLTNDHPVISGCDLPGGFDNRRTVYRRYAVLHLSLAPRPRLAALMHHDRPAIYISDEDLTLGMLGLRHWNIVGYRVESARQLVANLILHTCQHAAGPLASQTVPNPHRQ